MPRSADCLLKAVPSPHQTPVAATSAAAMSSRVVDRAVAQRDTRPENWLDVLSQQELAAKASAATSGCAVSSTPLAQQLHNTGTGRKCGARV